MSDPVNDLSTDQSKLDDIRTMVDLAKNEGFIGPYRLTITDENGDLVDISIDKDGNIVHNWEE